MGACAAIGIVLWQVFENTSIPALVPILFVAGLVLPAAVLGVRAWVRSGFEAGRSFREGLFDPSSSDKRVRIVLPIDEARRLRESPPDPDAAFEPEVARIPLARGLTDFSRRLAVLGGIAGFLAAFTFAWLVSGLGLFDAINVWLMIGGASAGATIIPEVFYPTWVRVVPGRVDIIRENLLARHIESVTSIDLREPNVLISLTAVAIDPPTDAEGRKAQPREAVSMFATLDRKRMRSAILAAAVSRVPTPDVSDTDVFG